MRGSEESFGLAVAVVALVVSAAVLSNRLSTRIRVPAPAFFLLTAAVAADLVPRLGVLPTRDVQDVVTAALVVLLFHGGMDLGWKRLKPNAGAVVWFGLVGTVGTGAILAVASRLAGFGWTDALLLGTALAPTDPAVVFSVLGRREIAGRTGVLLQGEAGANDPIGIALMAGLLAASSGSVGSAVARVGLVFLQQMGIGVACGAIGGLGLRAFVRKVPLPSAGLYPLRALAGAFALYGLTTVAHGSGFLAVFLAGLLFADARAPYKSETVHFHASLASLAEIVAFTVLGLTVPLSTFATASAWAAGLVLSVVLVLVARPMVIMLLAWPLRLRWGERTFLAFAGLKGAVPILLGSFALSAGRPHADRLFDAVFTAVAFSVIVQGVLLPTLARWCHLRMEVAELEPWALGVRLRNRPEGVRRVVVEPDSQADGAAVNDLDLGEDAWLSLVIRSGALLPVSGSTRLEADDEVLLLGEQEDMERLLRLFTV